MSGELNLTMADDLHLSKRVVVQEDRVTCRVGPSLVTIQYGL